MMLSSILNKKLLQPHRLLRFRRPRIGATPGELSLSPGESPTLLQVHCYSGEMLEQDVKQLEKYRDLPNCVLWIDVRGLTSEETVKKIAEAASIPDLMLEDMVNVPQRSGVNASAERLLIITRMISPLDNGHYYVEQVSLYLYKNIVVTFQEEDMHDVFEPVRKRLKNADDALRDQSAIFLIYTLLDVIVDNYFPVIEQMADHIQLLEQLALTRPRPALLKYLTHSRNDVIRLNRAILPQKEMVQQLIREKPIVQNPDALEHFKDVYDHTAQASEMTELLREMSATLLNLYMSAMANRTNEKMKVLTVMASIFIPLTFIVGVYGMNFDYMPELHYRWGYPIVWGVMIVVAGILLGYFYAKGWLVEKGMDLEKLLQEARETQAELSGKSVGVPIPMLPLARRDHRN